mgnify:CR=1 FL=1
MKNFSELGIKSELVAQLKKVNFENPTEVQEAVIPLVNKGIDLIVRAKTGTGKTGAFIIPIINNARDKEGLYALVIAPTRELALQVSNFAQSISRSLHVVTVYGGASINVQLERIGSANIVVGTPGRILDLIERGALNISCIRYLVLDEADIMLDMGFIDDIERIIANTSNEKQMMLFSATIPREIKLIASRYMRNPESVTIGEEDEITVSTIRHMYAVVEQNMKYSALLAYIDAYKPKKAIIFANTKFIADRIYWLLRNYGLDVILLHGGLTQAKREHSLSIFRRSARFMIATNLASRGLDIYGISDIINFDIPEMPNAYVHRTGRTARMGREGNAFTIVTPQERRLIKEIEYYANITMEQINLDARKFESAVRSALSQSERNYRQGFQRAGMGRNYYRERRFRN